MRVPTRRVPRPDELGEADFVDAEERVAAQEARYPEAGPLHRATMEEIGALRADLDARFFPGEVRISWKPNWARDRLRGATGD